MNKNGEILAIVLTFSLILGGFSTLVTKQDSRANGYGKADQNDVKQPIKWRVLSVDGDNAFSEGEKNAIRTTNVVTKFGATGIECITSDKIYLQAKDEMINPSYGFYTDNGKTETRQAKNTMYVSGLSNNYSVAGTSDDWWLRAYSGSYASDGVDETGFLVAGFGVGI